MRVGWWIGRKSSGPVTPPCVSGGRWKEMGGSGQRAVRAALRAHRTDSAHDLHHATRHTTQSQTKRESKSTTHNTERGKARGNGPARCNAEAMRLA
jgi:hypothetical protein